MLDYHIDMEHMLFESIPYESWQQLQRTRKRNLAAAFAADHVNGRPSLASVLDQTSRASQVMAASITVGPGGWP